MVTKNKKETTSEPLPFETVLKQLEDVVVKLESGELPLEQALNEFERGIHLTRSAQQQLQQAEQRIQILLSETDDAELAPFSN